MTAAKQQSFPTDLCLLFLKRSVQVIDRGKWRVIRYEDSLRASWETKERDIRKEEMIYPYMCMCDDNIHLDEDRDLDNIRPQNTKKVRMSSLRVA